jgi:putative tryptophan/tyrosine transport system substrate-binding protein
MLSVGSQADFDTVFATLVGQRVGAIVVSADPFFISRRDQLVELATRHAVPTIYPVHEFAAVGGLMSYGASFADAYYQAGSTPDGFSRVSDLLICQLFSQRNSS